MTSRLLRLQLLLVVVLGCGLAARQPAPVRAGAPLPSSAERAYRAVSARFDRAAALDVVRFLDGFWRVAGNPGYNASIDHIRDRLAAAGFRRGDPDAGARREAARPDALFWIDEFPVTSPGWDHQVATVAFAHGPDEDPLFSRDRDRVALCINSFSTPDSGLVAPLVDVGRGASVSDYSGRDVRGAIVLGAAPVGRLWQQAVRAHGAAGVISTDAAPYIRGPDPAGFTSEAQKDVFQWGAIPYDESVRSFAFKASWRVSERLRERSRNGPVSLRVRIASAFYPGPARSLVAEIRGRLRPDERIVLVAHVQEPGANDNASGSATLYAVARALAEAIRAGAIPPPSRTLTFLWSDEIRGSRHWLEARPGDASRVRYMFALDMTGEDVTKTGGSFLIEKQADPSAVWQRPSDPHTEWGSSRVTAESLKGSLLNDLHEAVCFRRARDTGWAVKTNPYEGGSDHTVFAAAGIPSLLNWHFTDRYYHTNQDRLDKVSAGEMENVGVAVATSAWFLASATVADAAATVDLIERAARHRLDLERRQGAALLEQAADKAAAAETERVVLRAWERWYREALGSVLTLPTEEVPDSLRRRVREAVERLEREAR